MDETDGTYKTVINIYALTVYDCKVVARALCEMMNEDRYDP